MSLIFLTLKSLLTLQDERRWIVEGEPEHRDVAKKSAPQQIIR
jgi:hypothetical protein